MTPLLPTASYGGVEREVLSTSPWDAVTDPWEWFKAASGEALVGHHKAILHRVAQHWQRLSREVVNVPSLSLFKRHLENNRVPKLLGSPPCSGRTG